MIRAFTTELSIGKLDRRFQYLKGMYCWAMLTAPNSPVGRYPADDFLCQLRQATSSLGSSIEMLLAISRIDAALFPPNFWRQTQRRIALLVMP